MPSRHTVPHVPPNEIIHIGTRKRLLSVVLYVLAFVLRFLNRFRRSRPERVLVLEPVGLGDLISFDPLVRELIARKYEVVLCAPPQWRPLFPEKIGMTWCDLRVGYASHNEKVKYQLRSYWNDPTASDLKRMREMGPGAVGIDTRGDIRSVLLLYWAGCKRVVSLSCYLGSDLPMSSLVAELIPFDNSLRRWEINAQFLQALDASFDRTRVQPPRLHHLIQREPKRRLGFMPTAPWAGKLWPRERWVALAEALRTDGWEVLAFCGPGQAGASREQLGPGIPIVECGSIESWAREFNRLAFVITVDSGPMHLADALGIPVIALYGQGKLPLWAPSAEGSVALAHRDEDFFVCHPVVSNTHLGQKYMNMISVDEVLMAARRLAGRIELEPSKPASAAPG